MVFKCTHIGHSCGTCSNSCSNTEICPWNGTKHGMHYFSNTFKKTCLFLLMCPSQNWQIPSAYARERLDLIKQLEQIREMGNADSWDEKKVLTLPSAETNVQSSRGSDDWLIGWIDVCNYGFWHHRELLKVIIQISSGSPLKRIHLWS